MINLVKNIIIRFANIVKRVYKIIFSWLLSTAGSETQTIPVMLACKGMVYVSNPDCETGTAPTASDKGAEGAADVRSTDGLWPVEVGP